MMTGSLILGGQLLGTAFACGLNLYLTLALLGLAGRFGWIQLPTGMGGLENGVVIGIAATLFLIEFIVDRLPLLGNAWEGVHSVIRPVAAALLTALALQDASTMLQAAGAIAAGALALAAHGSKAGIRLMVATRRARAHQPAPTRGDRLHTVIALAEDLVAVAVATAALLNPVLAPAILAASLLLLVLAGPRLWRAAVLGVRAVVGRARGFFSGRSWRSRAEMPGYVRAAVPVEPLGRSPARALPAAINGLPRVGSYRNGWLVFTCDGPLFVYRSLLGARGVPLPRIAEVNVRRGLMTDALDVQSAADPAPPDPRGKRPRRPRVFTIFLLKDGAHSHVAASELTTELS